MVIVKKQINVVCHPIWTQIDRVQLLIVGVHVYGNGIQVTELWDILDSNRKRNIGKVEFITVRMIVADTISIAYHWMEPSEYGPHETFVIIVFGIYNSPLVLDIARQRGV
jgi:hypothetical protein